MKLETEADSNQWVYAAKALAVVSAWNSLGWFDRLAKAPCLRSELDGDQRAIAATIPVLLHLGLISTDGERLALTRRARKLIDAKGVPTARNLEYFLDLAKMAQVLKEGGPVKDDQGRSKETQGGTRADDLAATERFLDMLYRMSQTSTEETLSWLAPLLPKGGAIIDVGGGHGAYAETFAKAGYRATLMDQPHVIEIAKKRHGDGLAYLSGDFHTLEDFGGPYDVALFSNIVHSESAEQNASMIRRAAKSLRPGGIIAVKDMFIDEQGRDPENAIFFGLTMLFYTRSGSSPTLRAIREWYDAAGLRDFRVIALDTHQLVLGKRPI